MEPTIELFAVQAGGAEHRLNPLMEPPQVFDLAFVMGGVLEFFRKNAEQHEKVATAWDDFLAYTAANSERVESARKAFAHYCANASDLGSLTGETDWCRSVSEFHDQIGVFLGRLLLDGSDIRPGERTAAMGHLLLVFERMVAHVLENIAQMPAQSESRRAELSRQAVSARESLEKLLEVYRRAESEGKTLRIAPGGGAPASSGAVAAPDVTLPPNTIGRVGMFQFPFERVEPDELCLYEMKSRESITFVEQVMTKREFAMFASHLMGGYMLAQQMKHESFRTALEYLHRFREIQSPKDLANLDALFERYARLAWPDAPDEWKAISPHIQSFLLQALIFNGGIDKELFGIQSMILNMLGACVERISQDKDWLLSLADGDAGRARNMAECMRFTVETCRDLGKQFAEAFEKNTWLMIRPRVHATISVEGYTPPTFPRRAEDLLRPMGPKDLECPEGPWDLWFFRESPQGDPDPIGLLMKTAHFAVFAEMFANVYENLAESDKKQTKDVAEVIRKIGSSAGRDTEVLKHLFRRYVTASFISVGESAPDLSQFESMPEEVRCFLTILLVASAPLTETEMLLLRNVGEFFGRSWRMLLKHPERWECPPDEREDLLRATEICAEICERLAQYMYLAMNSSSIHFIRVRGT